MKRLFLIAAGLLACLFGPAAHAAPAPQASNKSCATARDLGEPPMGQPITGVARPSKPDYYKLRTTPGADLQVYVKRGASDRFGIINFPMAGVFDAQCRQIAATPEDEPYHNGQAKLRFTAPADGVIVLDITTCCNLVKGGTEQGAYVATVKPYLPPPILAGTVVDSSGQALGFSPVTLYQCPSASYQLCSAWVAGGYTDEQGHYNLETTYLDSYGTYQLGVQDWSFHANQPQRSRTFNLDRGDFTADFTMKPLPVTLDNVTWAQGSVPKGGTVYAVATLSNHSTRSAKLDLWLAVNATETGEEGGAAWYQIGQAGAPAPQRITLAAGQSMEVALPFSPPVNALAGAYGDLTLFVSEAGQPSNTYTASMGLAYDIAPDNTAHMQSGAAIKARQERALALKRQMLQRQLGIRAARP